MKRSNALVILGREYGSRVRTRGFWIATLIFPLLIGGIFSLPVLLISSAVAIERLVVVDETGRVGPVLARQLSHANGDQPAIASFEIVVEELGADVSAQRRALDRRVLAEEIDAWLWIGREGLAENRVEYHAHSVSNVLTQQVLERELSEAVRRARLEEAGYDAASVAPLVRSVKLRTVRITEGGSRSELAQSRFLLAYGLSFLLYAILAIYGAQVMNGVIEEKNTRVVELIVSSVRPFDLMMGKLVGIGLVGLTQLAIWVGGLLLGTRLLGDVLAARPVPISLPVLQGTVVVHFFALFVVGYFFYASFYAAVGSAFNTVQEAQQFAFVAVLALLASFMFFVPVINDPDSPLAVVSSLIPFFSPLIMMLRIAVKTPPLWQILLAYALALGSTVLMVALCAKVYRVGILMHGKKPTLRELWRWVRYT